MLCRERVSKTARLFPVKGEWFLLATVPLTDIPIYNLLFVPVPQAPAFRRGRVLGTAQYLNVIFIVLMTDKTIQKTFHFYLFLSCKIQ